MGSKKPTTYLSLLADVTAQDMSLFSRAQDTDTHAYISVQFKAKIRDGIYKGQALDLQISRELNFDITNDYAGALYQIKPNPMFSVSTDPERFGYLVSLIAAKAVKEIYLCFETPKYGRARVISWHISTTQDE